MRNATLLLFSIFMLIIGCKSFAQEILTENNYNNDSRETFSYYLDSKGEKVKHGFYSFFNKEKESHVNYINGKREGMQFNKWNSISIIKFFLNDALTSVTYFNNMGEKIGTCTVKDDKPYAGKIWSIAFGLNGVKWCIIATYKDGLLIKEEDCDLQGKVIDQTHENTNK